MNPHAAIATRLICLRAAHHCGLAGAFLYCAVLAFGTSDSGRLSSLKERESTLTLRLESFGNYAKIETPSGAICTKEEVYHDRGLTRYELKDYQGWLEDENAAIALDPSTHPEFYWGRGNAKSWLDDYDGQIRDFETALDLVVRHGPADEVPAYRQRLRDARRDLSVNYEARDWPAAHAGWKKGRDLQEKDDHAAAVDSFSLAIMAHPSFALAYHERGLSRGKIGDDPGAVEDGAIAVAKDPGNSHTHNVYAEALGRIGLLEEALAELELAVQCARRESEQPETTDYAKVRDTARAELAPALAVAQSHPDAYAAYEQGRERYAKRDFEGALREYDRALQLFPGYERAKARRTVERVALPYHLEARDHPDAYASFAYGRQQMAAKRHKDAVVDFSWCIQFDPNWEPAYYQRSRARHEAGDYAEALEDAATAIRLNPKDPLPYWQHGVIASALGLYETRVEDYEIGWKVARETGASDAEDYHQAWLRAKQDLPPGWTPSPQPEAGAVFLRACLKFTAKDYRGALADFDRAIALRPDCAYYYAKRGLTRGWIDDDQGNVDDQTKAIALDPTQAKYYDYRANALGFLQPKDRARAEARCADWEKAVALQRTVAPQSDELKEYIAALAKARSERDRR